jgi:thiol-disulfide isomerase/thioredoxin
MNYYVSVLLVLVAMVAAFALMWRTPSKPSNSPGFSGVSKGMLVVLAILLVALAVWSYRRYASIPYNANLELQGQSSGPDTVNFMVFSADWCPACRRASAPLKEVRDKYEGKVRNGKTLIFTTHDCSDLEDTGGTAEVRRKYDVKRFPTIKIVKGSQVIDFEGERSVANLEQFIDAAW